MKRRRSLLMFVFLLLASATLVWVAAQSSEKEVAPLETFVPSEELTADGAVSFPVDI